MKASLNSRSRLGSLPRRCLAALVGCALLIASTATSRGMGLGGPYAPFISTQPADAMVIEGQTASFSVLAFGNPAPTYQWRRNGVNFVPASDAPTLTLANIPRGAAGNYDVVITNSKGSVTSRAATLTVVVPTPPTIATQPASAALNQGQTATFSVVAASNVPVSYQWKKDGVAIPGAASSTYAVINAQAASAGGYTVDISNSASTVTSSVATLTVFTTNAAGRLINLSIRTRAGTGAQVLTAGFAIAGAGTKQLLVRGIGPALAQFGVTDVLADPRIEFFDGQTSVAANDDWDGGPMLASTFSSAGAFALPFGSKDAALVGNFSPKSYTVQLTGAGGATGLALAELYDLDRIDSETRLINLSGRCSVGTGADKLNAGFVIGGAGSRTLLIRAVGPALNQFGVPGVLADPRLKLYNSSGRQIYENDDWGGSSSYSAAFAQAGAFALPTGSKDAALVVVLPAGAYTAEVSGVNSTTGAALVEIYDLNP